MACVSLQPRLFSSFFGDRLPLCSRPIVHVLGYVPGTRNTFLLPSRTQCNLADLLFNG
ncbi:hypothetical protein HPP92_027506, partial [Vanilla planifolia]